MGMYDMINGEQVKCFPVVYLYEEAPAYSMGSLNSYNTGDTVPYRTLYYNYTKNFNVIELNTWRSAFEPYDFIIHTVRDGKVVCTKTDSADDSDFDGANVVVNYFGDLVNIHSVDEIYEYLNVYREAETKLDKLREKWTKLFSESLTIGRKYVQIEDKDSPKAQQLSENIDKIHRDMRAEEMRTKSQREEIEKSLSQRWGCDTDDENLCIRFGEYLDIIRKNLELREENKGSQENLDRIENRIQISRNAISKMMEANENLLDMFFTWYDATEYEKEKIRKYLSE